MAKVMVAQTYGQLECCTRLTPTCFQTIGFWIFKLFQKSSGSAVRPLLLLTTNSYVTGNCKLPPTFKTSCHGVSQAFLPPSWPGSRVTQCSMKPSAMFNDVQSHLWTFHLCVLLQRGGCTVKGFGQCRCEAIPDKVILLTTPLLSSQNCYCCPVKYVSLLQIWTKVAVFKSESTLDIILLAPTHCQRIAVTLLLL